MKTRLGILGVLMVAVVAAVPAAEDWRLVVKLQGQVHSSVDNQVSWQPVFASRLLRVNDAARTLAASKARIQLPDGSVAIMAPNTTAVLQEFDQQQGKVKIYVETGGVRAKVTKAFGRGRFELNTKNGVLAAQGTEYAVLYEDKNVLGFVYEGTISLDTPQGSTTLLHAGETARMTPDGQIQVNPPGVTTGMLPPELLPDEPIDNTKETSTYMEATGSGQASALSRFTQLNGLLLPSDAGRIGGIGTGLPSGGGPASPVGPTGPVGPANTGTIQVDIRF